MSLEAFANNAKKTIQENSPSILAALAVGGVVTTGLLAHKAGYDTGRDMERYVDAYPDDPMTGKDKFDRYWKQHAPVFIVGLTSIACIIGSTAINNRRNAALAGLVTLGEVTLREYRDKVASVVTKQKNDQIEREIAQDKMDKAEGAELVFIGNDKVLCFDVLTSRFFESSRLDIEKAEVEMNRRLLQDMYVSQNEWYDAIGLPRTLMGDDHGWNHDLPLEVKFEALLREDKPVLAINYRFRPSIGFDRFG